MRDSDAVKIGSLLAQVQMIHPLRECAAMSMQLSDQFDATGDSRQTRFSADARCSTMRDESNYGRGPPQAV
jgi:hypothetical protein